MHYPVYLFTDEFPTDEVISKAIAPFNEDSEETNPNPIISFDYWVLGGRYNGAIKLRCDDDDEADCNLALMRDALVLLKEHKKRI